MSDCPHKTLVKVHDSYVCHFCRKPFSVIEQSDKFVTTAEKEKAKAAAACADLP